MISVNLFITKFSTHRGWFFLISVERLKHPYVSCVLCICILYLVLLVAYDIEDCLQFDAVMIYYVFSLPNELFCWAVLNIADNFSAETCVGLFSSCILL